MQYYHLAKHQIGKMILMSNRIFMGKQTLHICQKAFNSITNIAYANSDRQIANRHSLFQAAMFFHILVSDEL